jgi:predicted dehydrogenase
MSKIRWGILSAANIAYEQLVPALRRSERAEVLAVASRNKSKAEKFNLPVVYDNYKDLINDPKIDAIYIPLPNSLHYEWTLNALNAGKHVLIEKPAVLNEKELIEIKRLAQSNNLIVMEAFMYQFHRQHEIVKNLLVSNTIGEIRNVKTHFSWMLENPNDIRLNKNLGGGAMWDVGCYGVHTITQIIGMKPSKVAMHAKLHPVHEVDMTSSCVLMDENGIVAEITASMELPFIDYYHIIGTEGTITVESSYRPDVSPDGRGKVTVKDSKGNIVLYQTVQSDQYLIQVEHFQDCIINQKQPIYNLDNSIEVISCIEKCYESLKDTSIEKY